MNPTARVAKILQSLNLNLLFYFDKRILQRIFDITGNNHNQTHKMKFFKGSYGFEATFITVLQIESIIKH